MNLMLPLLSCLIVLGFAASAEAREWFVAASNPAADDSGDGSVEHPLRTINAAAQLAQPGDVVTVGAGIYREWISPARGGTEEAPIVYRSVPAHAAIVRGTEPFDGQWQAVPDDKGVFIAKLPTESFLFDNPFARPKPGEGNVVPRKTDDIPKPARGMVFIKDAVLPQVMTRDELLKTPGSWLVSDDPGELRVHFRDGAPPAPGAMEITTRDRLFAPHRRGLGYIQVEGFVFERCATRRGWPQLGALSTRSGNHWVIRNNIVRNNNAKGIDCGSEVWRPELLLDTEPEERRNMLGGHHLLEGNVVSDNGQCGIAAWNTQSVRIIGNIATGNGSLAVTENFFTDAESAGIKVHGFRHGSIEGNLVIDNPAFGIWLDNGFPDARVTRNVCVANRGAGIFVELGFGPVLVDHNLSIANTRLAAAFLGDGIYTHDASGVSCRNNTLLGNEHFGIEMRIVSDRMYAKNRLVETSDQCIENNLILANRSGAISLPLETPRSKNNRSDYNAFDRRATYSIGTNAGRITSAAIIAACRSASDAADLPEGDRPTTSPDQKLPTLNLTAWRVVMKLDQNSRMLPAGSKFSIDREKHLLILDIPEINAWPALHSTVPATAGGGGDLLGQPAGDSAPAGAVNSLHPGRNAIRYWPLPAPASTQPRASVKDSAIPGSAPAMR